MQIKIYNASRKIVALSDSELIGKSFEEGIKRIEIGQNFFQGEEKSKEEVIKILKNMEKEDAAFNIVGKKSVETALDCGIIDKEGIITIQGIPIALVLF